MQLSCTDHGVSNVTCTRGSIGFLLKVLEMQSCRLGWSVEFVQETLRKVGVPMEALLPVYDRLIKANVR